MRPRPHRGLIALTLLVGAPFAISAQRSTPLTELRFDGAEEGRLWVRAQSYKASFDGGGARFMPFLGANAPRHEPLGLRVRAVTVDGSALEFDRTVAPQRASETISFARGAFVELYHVRPEGLEQAFRFDAPVAIGELAIRIAVDTPLAARAEGGGVTFECAAGGARYGRATAIDAAGLRTNAPVTLEGDELVIRVPADFVARASWPLLVDPLISSFAIDDSPAEDRFVDVAYDASLDLYAVCWQRRFSADDHDVFGQLLDSSGATLREFAIDVSGDDRTRPKIAGIDALDQFLVATLGSGPAGTVATTRTLDLASGQLEVGAPVEQLTNCLDIDLGGDAGSTPPYRYCLVASTNFVGVTYVDVRLVESNGQPGAFFYLGDSKYYATSPRISKTARGPEGGPRAWSFIWEEWFVAAFPTMKAGIVRLDGTYESNWAVGGGDDDRVEAVSSMLEGASGDLPFLAVTRHLADGGPDRLWGRVMRGGAAETPWTPLGDEPGVDYVSADVDADGSSFVVVQAEGASSGAERQIHAATYQLADGLLRRVERVSLSSSGGVHGKPALTSTRSGGGGAQRFFAAWHVEGGGDGDVHAALYDSPGVGVPYCIGAPNSTGPGARLYATGSISVARNELTLAVDGCPPNRPGIFFLGLTPIELPFGEGFRCVGDPTRRVQPVVTTDAAGVASLQLDFNQVYGDLVGPGSPGVNYQFWYRDPAGGPAAFNLSDALHVEHTP